MGLFTQDIELMMSDSKKLFEKHEIKLDKKKIRVIVKSGYGAVVNGIEFSEGITEPININSLKLLKKDTITAYIYPKKKLDVVSMKFFANQHQCSISRLPNSVALFAITGDATVYISDYRSLIQNYEREITKDDLIKDINAKYRILIGNEISNAADKFITNDTTEVELKGKLDDIVNYVFANGSKADLEFQNIGLKISKSSVKLTLNPLEGTDELTKKAFDKINEKALEAFDKEEQDEEYQRGQEELAKSRQFDIDMERAKNTSISENKTEIIKSGSGDVTINQKSEDRFCIKCGSKLPKNAIFCPKCGEKQE